MRIRLVLVLVLTACNDGGPAARSPSPAADVRLLGEDRSGTVRCGEAELRWTNPEAFEGEASLEVTSPDGGTLLSERTAGPGERLVPRGCGDALGDGRTVLLYERYSGGAHCCTTLRVVALPDDLLLEAELGNAGVQGVQQLDGAGALEIVTSSDVFAYFADMPFAASPFLPLVLAFRDGGYATATSRFGDLVRRDLDEAYGLLSGEGSRTGALQAFGDGLILGRADAVVAEIRERTDPGTAAWLDEHRTDAERTFRDGYGP